MTSSTENIVSATTTAPMAVPKLTTELAGSLFAVVHAQPDEIDVACGMDHIVETSIAALVKTGLVFDRGGLLVAIDRDNTIHTLTPVTARFALSKVLSFVKSRWTKSGVVTEPAIVPGYVGDVLTSLTKWPNMPIVEAISDHPIVGCDGVLIGAGYNEKSRIFGRYDPAKFLISDDPTFDDAAAALATLTRLLQTFDFEHDGDNAASLASMFTAVCRPAIATAPMTLLDATVSGSGKGYLGSLFARLAEDREPVAKQMKADDAEMDKQIIAALMAARAVCFFDELGMAEIDLPSLRSFASAPRYGGRVLGLSKDVDFAVRQYCIATGNNVSPTADMARRMLQIRLAPQCENPSCRDFVYTHSDPMITSAARDVVANRAAFISCVLTIQRAYLQHKARGETPPEPTKIGGFDEWETLCRAPIIWLSKIDPCRRMLETMSSNPAKNELLTIMTAWRAAFGNIATKAGEALCADDFVEVCRDTIRRKPGSDISNVSLGLWLKRHKGQIVDGHRFIEHSVQTGITWWAVEKVG